VLLFFPPSHTLFFFFFCVFPLNSNIKCELFVKLIITIEE
jgi:hypothetical protein